MYEFKVKNSRGEELNLTTTDKYTLYKIDGLQPPAVNISSSSNSNTDGITVNNVKVDKRNIVIYLTVNGDVETNRINLYKYFPLKDAVMLYYKNDTRDVSIKAYVELMECDFFAMRQIVQISLICPQPYFKEAEELVTTFSDVTPTFEFPFSIDSEGIEFSTITTNIRKAIINSGDVESGIIITLTASTAVTNPTIYDVYSRTQMSFNMTLQQNDQLIIDTYSGEKSIRLLRNGVYSNAIGYLVPNSTWLTLKSGENLFTYEADSGESGLMIEFRTSVLYGGV